MDANINPKIEAVPAAGLTGAAKTVEEWAKEIRTGFRAAKSSTLGLARIYHAAKCHLARGEWTRMWKLPRELRPPRTKRTGDKYALIGQEFGDANENWPSHLAEQLPDGVDTLYLLAQIGRQLVLELILDGTVHEGLTAGKALALRNKYRPDLNKKRRFKFGNWLAQFGNLLAELEDEGTPRDRKAAIPFFHEAIGRLAPNSLPTPYPLAQRAA
jgi:hypothetical protein